MSFSLLPLLIIGAIVIVLAVVLIFIGVRNPGNFGDRELANRLEEFSERGEQVDLEKIEMSMPFAERIVFPIARKLGEIAIKFTPQNALQSTAKKLELAGSPGRLDPTMFLALQFIASVLIGGLLLLVFSLGKSNFKLGQQAIFVIGGFGFGFYLPQLWISGKISRRQKEVRKALPDALDLLTICVEAGLGFDAAMQKVSEKWQSELSMAFARVIQEVALGKVRREALKDMADRLGIPEMTSFVAAVIQSEQLGVSMAKVLRIQSDQMRVKRRQLAEEEAHKAPVKMLIPMALLIFPSLMITLMTPAALRMMNSALAGMFGK
jgi:tight adherence protein C